MDLWTRDAKTVFCGAAFKIFPAGDLKFQFHWGSIETLFHGMAILLSGQLKHLLPVSSYVSWGELIKSAITETKLEVSFLGPSSRARGVA
jgi:hypothetical protein